MALSRWQLVPSLIWTLAGCGTPSALTIEADHTRLLELHAQVMEAHRGSNVDLIMQAETDQYVVANRGEVTHPTVEERRGRLGPYLSRTRFKEYVDVIPPMVRVSQPYRCIRRS